MTYTTYWNVPEGERWSLTAEQIDALCRTELAEHGHLYPKPLPILPEELPKIETTTFYRPQVACYDKLSIAFASMESAVAFLALNAVEVVDDYRTDTAHSQPFADMSIEPVELPTKEQLGVVKEALTEARSNKSENDKNRKEFDLDTRTCDDLVEGVRKDWRDRISHESSLQHVRDTFDEFLEIAGGNEIIATRFLLKQRNREIITEALGEKAVFECVDEGEVST